MSASLCAVMALMWHVRSAICPFQAIHIITTCCLDSWILSVMRLGDIQAYFAIAYLATGGLLILAGPVLSRGDHQPQHARPIVQFHLHLWSMCNDSSSTAKHILAHNARGHQQTHKLSTDFPKVGLAKKKENGISEISVLQLQKIIIKSCIMPSEALSFLCDSPPCQKCCWCGCYFGTLPTVFDPLNYTHWWIWCHVNVEVSSPSGAQTPGTQFCVLAVQKRLCHCYHTSQDINPFLFHGKCTRWHRTITAVNFKAVPLWWIFPPCSLGRREDFLRHNKQADVLLQIVMNQMLERIKKRVSSMGNQRGVAERMQQSAATRKIT